MLDVKEALDHMLKKMEVDWGCQPLATVLWDTGWLSQDATPALQHASIFFD